jgi:uncharacterized protein (TIGR02246 family)
MIRVLGPVPIGRRSGDRGCSTPPQPVAISWRWVQHTLGSAPFPSAVLTSTLGLMTTTTNDITITPDTVTAWVDRYLAAWTTNDPEDIAGLFTEDGEYHEGPYKTDWTGRDEIVEGWRSRWDWQQGGWSFDWQLVSITGATAVITGVGRYTKLGNFDNHWTVTFGTPELCANFAMVNTAREED